MLSVKEILKHFFVGLKIFTFEYFLSFTLDLSQVNPFPTTYAFIAQLQV